VRATKLIFKRPTPNWIPSLFATSRAAIYLKSRWFRTCVDNVTGQVDGACRVRGCHCTQEARHEGTRRVSTTCRIMWIEWTGCIEWIDSVEWNSPAGWEEKEGEEAA